MRRRKFFAAVGVLLLTAMLSSCQGSREKTAPSQVPETSQVSEEGGEKLYLSMATSGNWGQILRGNLWDTYCQKLLEWSDGRIVMNGYFNGSLGNDLEIIEGVKEGTLCIINSVPSYQISAVPEAALLDVPGMFDSTGEYNYFIENYYKDTLQSYYHKKGIRLLSSSAFDFRIMTSNTPVRSMDDLKGFKLRTMENKYHIAFWQAMGASVFSMNFNEFRMAIQQNLLQGQENPVGYMVSARFSDVQNNVILTNHVLMISNYLMNEEQYEALSEEDKELLQRFFDEMGRELVEQQPAENEKMLRNLREEGIEVYDAAPDIKEAIIERGQPIVLEMLREDLGDAVVDDFLEKVKEAKADYHNRS